MDVNQNLERARAGLKVALDIVRRLPDADFNEQTNTAIALRETLGMAYQESEPSKPSAERPERPEGINATTSYLELDLYTMDLESYASQLESRLRDSSGKDEAIKKAIEVLEYYEAGENAALDGPLSGELAREALASLKGQVGK